ncbi:threonine ammonia-lyase [Yinghuangia soli]|uniref:Pyridoxal-phosphate dependent enzyme n=1 Tax=Yinghuangia soli TaxID=2908204 RepID=A0AA41Q856_9ACTN|nr:pyridoxal-phosphate dependent enzyme [Yinghuangia soli]MCF2533389.1 pyridoxal-phosphate dependent enzyme [Yinghuangia soli]
MPDDISAPYDLARARAVVARHLVPTPLIATGLAPGALLKLETMQPVGAFKVRGALAALDALPPGASAVTASAGNHALGMAYAAGPTGREVTVVVARDASPAKIAKLRGSPIELVLHGSGFDEAEGHALKLAAERGAHYVSAYAHPDVIAGQATIGTEIAAEVPGPLTVVCAVGGGGLAAGLALWAREHGDARVVGVEVEASRAVSTAVHAGRIMPCEIGDSIADGLTGNLEDGCPTPDVLRAGVRDGTVRLTHVSESEVHDAMRWLFTHHGIVVEGAGAAAAAAVLAGRVPAPDRGRLAVVLSGRNITADAYAKVLHHD